MSKKNIAIVFPSRKNGGVFQLTLSIAENLIRYYHSQYNYYLIHYKNENIEDALEIDKGSAIFISIPQACSSRIRKILHFINLAIFKNSRIIDNATLVLRDAKIDLVIYPTPFTYDFLRDLPFIAYIPNMMHKYYPDFSEFPLQTRIARDIVYKYYAQKAILYASDSTQGIEDIHKFLGIPLDKGRVIPFIPAGYIYRHKDIDRKEIEILLAKYNLPEKFIFYPAQFWYHKNHLRLIRALRIIKDKYHEAVNLVLVGGDTRRYEKIAQEIFAEAEKAQIKQQIIHLGYVSDTEMVALYKKSLALVNPSLLGPTGIPFVEAIVLGVPIIGPNIWEVPRVVDKAGVLFDPFNSRDMAEKIYSVWQDSRLRAHLKKEAQLLAKGLTPENYAKQWQQVISQSLEILAKGQ